MTLRVAPVDVTHIQQVWPSVEGFIDEALTKGHDFPDWSRSYTKEHVQLYLTSGQWLLFVAVDDENKVQGAATVSFINYPLHRVAFMTTTGGKFIVNPEVFDQLKAICKQYGATKIQAYCRESMVRLAERCNFEPRNTLVEVLI